MNCKVIIEDLNPVAFTGATYRNCDRVAKYMIKFKSPVNGKQEEKCVCGLHFKQAQKNCQRLKEKRNFDAQFEFEII